MNKKIKSALISVFYKDGLEPIVKKLSELSITIYSTGGTQSFIEKLGVKVIPVESLTSYPSILGGRVKTLHPSVFGGILGKRSDETHLAEMKEYHIPEIDLVIVDLYPFEETVESTTDEKLIIEKIDIGGPSMIRAAAKNFVDVVVIAHKREYPMLEKVLEEHHGETSLEQRRTFATLAFNVVKNYDIAISDYFNKNEKTETTAAAPTKTLRYGENPHQQAIYRGNLDEIFTQLHGKELSYNNLVDVDAALQLISEFKQITFAIIKHNNVCGIASRDTVHESWKAAFAGDPESAFGGVLISNSLIDKSTADAINELFFEVLIAPAFEKEALDILKMKKNRILLQQKKLPDSTEQYCSILNGTLIQSIDKGNTQTWDEVGGRESTESEKEDLIFANLVCKHLKSNAIALVKNKQLIGKGCGQTSRIDSVKQAVEKSKQFKFDLKGAVMASDAFFPFSDSVKIAHQAGIKAFIQPGGSIRDNESVEYCKTNDLAMVITGMRHFRH